MECRVNILLVAPPTEDRLIKLFNVILDYFQFESILNRLPGPLANWLTCVYGERYQSEDERCNKLKFNCVPFAAAVTQKKCHLDHYNRYEFVLTVEHALDGNTSPILIRTIASNRFRVSYLFAEYMTDLWLKFCSAGIFIFLFVGLYAIF